MNNDIAISACKGHGHEGGCCGKHKHQGGCGCGHKHSKGDSSINSGLGNGSEKTATDNDWTSTNLK